jgi:hypothetical protein
VDIYSPLLESQRVTTYINTEIRVNTSKIVEGGNGKTLNLGGGGGGCVDGLARSCF